MGERLIRLTACLMVVLAVPGALLFLAFGLPTVYDETYLAGLQDKWDTLAELPGNRIVIAGGSGAAFGLRCDLLEQELPEYSAVNFGLYAGLGTTVMLELMKPLLREGDIVIFSPEQSSQTLSDFFGPETMWQAADGKPELLTALSAMRWGKMAGSFPTFAGEKTKLWLEKNQPAGDGVYARSSFNAYGDIQIPNRDRNVMAGGFDPNMPISFDPALPTAEFLDAVNDFSRWCGENGITFCYRDCPMNGAAASGEERTRLADFHAQLAEKLDCPILGNPEALLMDAGWFFDTNFHLNDAGAVVNTAMLAGELKELLGITEPVTIELPEMPPLGEAEVVSGSNEDENCFCYAPLGDGWEIVGLTDQGKVRECLTIPATHDGQMVVRLAAGALAENDFLQELTIQESLRAIQDGAFAGCGALTRIVLEQPNPERLSVGPGLLTGTDGAVIVPSGRLAAYRTNYFWAVHAQRIQEDEPSQEETLPEPPKASGPGIRYEGNGGALKSWASDAIELPVDNAHLRVNTAQGSGYFAREGYVLTGWNTAADGSGQSVGLGSRMERQENLVLFAQWAKANPETDFRWEMESGELWITEYLGAGETCVVPETVAGERVHGIRQGAFREKTFFKLVLPSGLRALESGAFQNCVLDEMILFDGLQQVSDGSFNGCDGPITLRINACVRPVYSGTYFDTFSDKFDRLLSLRGQRKLVLFSGSSGRYGYDSPALEQAFPEYHVVNMGVYAYTNALPQLDLILGQMEAGDVLLSAPEFDASQEQFCASNRLDPAFFAMMESNYDAVSLLDLREYAGVFDAFGAYQQNRKGMPGRSYGESPSSYDDDGNRYAFPTYNLYGDLILPRANSEKDECLRHNIADYTTGNITPEKIQSLNQVYQRFLDQGIQALFTYTPRNRWSITPESTPESRQALHEALREGLCVDVISELEDSLYPGTYFYLIDSHLSSQGAALRTRQVIESLKPWLTHSQGERSN